jgi:hypothetical protein
METTLNLQVGDVIFSKDGSGAYEVLSIGSQDVTLRLRGLARSCTLTRAEVDRDFSFSRINPAAGA